MSQRTPINNSGFKWTVSNTGSTDPTTNIQYLNLAPSNQKIIEVRGRGKAVFPANPTGEKLLSTAMQGHGRGKPISLADGQKKYVKLTESTLPIVKSSSSTLMSSKSSALNPNFKQSSSSLGFNQNTTQTSIRTQKPPIITHPSTLVTEHSNMIPFDAESTLPIVKSSSSTLMSSKSSALNPNFKQSSSSLGFNQNTTQTSIRTQKPPIITHPSTLVTEHSNMIPFDAESTLPIAKSSSSTLMSSKSSALNPNFKQSSSSLGFNQNTTQTSIRTQKPPIITHPSTLVTEHSNLIPFDADNQSISNALNNLTTAINSMKVELKCVNENVGKLIDGQAATNIRIKTMGKRMEEIVDSEFLKLDLPIKTPEQLLEIEQKLQIESFRRKMVILLQRRFNDWTLTKVMKRMFAPSILEVYNIKGTHGKQAFKCLNIYHILEELCPDNFEAELGRAFHLQQMAMRRIKLKNKNTKDSADPEYDNSSTDSCTDA